jgi:hypothetical protein
MIILEKLAISSSVHPSAFSSSPLISNRRHLYADTVQLLDLGLIIHST